ncbi:hypothetical protein [Vibrio caribbeanicus]|uniref:hypothetical protein n=1 Tax=Vibrio caribbeanicus TaxID=701175 RepID=UPI002283D756|nr:hypothetical protein [Vibrio caribbeanicus]MCY9846364.1 hypothetical protein [Vibrio caribbeanicus]
MNLQQVIGQEIYDLLYKHCDANGHLIEDMEDVLYCDDRDIDQERISELEVLLVPITSAQDSLIPIEASKILAAWGSEKAIEYLEFCIDERIDCLGNLDPHRIHGDYDTTYERMVDSLFQYYTRYTERDYAISNTYHGELAEKAKNKINAPLVKIITLSKELTLDMGYLIKVLKHESWKEYLPTLKECYLDFMQRPEKDLNRQWNLLALTELLNEWDPDFLTTNKVK